MYPLFSDRRARALAALACTLVLGSTALRAQSTGGGARDSAAASEAKGVVFNGLVSTTYSYNFNSPASHTNGLRVFDFDDNSFKIDVVEIVAQKLVEQPSEAGFRVDATMGASIPRVTASSGLFRGPGGAQDIDLQQAYVSYMAPVGRGLRFDLGKFVTPHGYELIEGYDGYNDNATRSFLFGYAIPFTHTGLRLVYAASPQFTASVMAINGWDVVKDNNNAKSACAQVLVTPADGLSFSLCYIGGAERDTNDTDMRHLVDLVATWKVCDGFSIGLNGDYGTDQNAVVEGTNAQWQGAALYLKLAVSDPFTLALRGEYFDDHDGFRTGTRQILKEVTLTPEFHPAPNVAIRADLRMDFSTEDVFDKDGAATNRQPTLLLNGLYVF